MSPYFQEWAAGPVQLYQEVWIPAIRPQPREWSTRRPIYRKRRRKEGCYMCSHYPHIDCRPLAWLTLLVMVAGCQREERTFQPAPVNESAPMQIRTTDLQAGASTPLQPDARRAQYEN